LFAAVTAMEGEERRRTRRPHELAPAALIAVLLHLQLAVLVAISAYLWAPRQATLESRNVEAIDITALDEETSRTIAEELDRKEAEERKKEEESPKAPGQVVELPAPRPDEEVPPSDARFAAERDSSVAKETKRTAPPERDRPAPARPPALALRTPRVQPRPPAPPIQPGTPGGPSTPSGQSPETEAVAPPGPPGAPGSPTPPAPPAFSLMPTQATLARALGRGTSDYLPDLDEGEDTALNARKWKFAAFFNRVKEQIRQHWHAAQEYQKRDPTGAVYGGRTRFTLLRVQLKPDGTLVDVRLEQPSGVDFLDDVAVDAVKEAQPFPNPPQQLVESGVISFRFGFVVDVSGETRLKVFRYSSM
jgi:TonB family protein